MLSLAQCKKILSEKGLSDADVETIREQLYQLSTILVDNYLQQNQETMNSQKDSGK